MIKNGPARVRIAGAWRAASVRLRLGGSWVPRYTSAAGSAGFGRAAFGTSPFGN